MESKIMHIGQEEIKWLWRQIAELFHLSEDGLATVAYTGEYSALSGKPTIPTKTSQLTNDSNYISDKYYVHTDNNFTNILKGRVENQFSGQYSDLSGKPDLTKYATLEQTEDMIDGAVGSVYTFKGTAASVAALPATGNTYGDVYAVGNTSYAWNGTEWVEMYAAVNLSAYMKLSDMTAISAAQIATLFA